MKTFEYTCEHCGGEFCDLESNQEKADREYRERFPQSSKKDSDKLLVCDDCYRLLEPRFRH